MKKLRLFEEQVVGETFKEYFGAQVYTYDEMMSLYNELANKAEDYIQNTDKKISKGSGVANNKVFISATIMKDGGDTTHKETFEFSILPSSLKDKEIVIMMYRSNEMFVGDVIRLENANRKVSNNYLKNKYKPRAITPEDVKAEMDRVIQHSKQ